jgi:signal transduction histidine kinase
MSVAPHALWSERFEEIGSLIEHSADLLTERWQQRVVEERRDGLPAHHRGMRDRLPDLLRAMGRALAVSNNSVPAAHTLLAVEHGEQRWHIGWRLAEVFRDYQILRLVIVEYLDVTLSKPLQTREVMAIGLALDESISASVLTYVGFQESQLRDANRRLTDFLPVLGHELRNPLSAIVGAMEVVHLSKTSEAMRGEAFDIIDRQLAQITRLVNDISDVSRIVRGQLELRLAKVDLRESIEQSVETLSALIAERGHKLTLSIPDEPMWVRADPARLRQVLGNLLSNAAKYTPPDGQILLEAEGVQNQALVRVRDTGAGIPQTLLPHVFDMFAQGPEHRHQGLGIGLALVHALVNLHKGKITAASAGPGQGSEFVIELPLIDERQEAGSTVDPRRAAIEAPCFRILLVDDHVDSAQMLAILLERSGHEVRVAHDGPTALSEAETYKPNVILVDIGLPGMDGFELARAFRGRPEFVHVPLVAVTGYANESDRLRAREVGFNHHLSKPADLESVQALLATFRRR